MKKGFSLLELFLIMSVSTVFLTTISLSLYVGYQNNLRSGVSARAVFLANEGVEGLKNIRENRFFDLKDGVFDLITSGGAWSLQSFTESPGEALQRKITITTIDATPNQEKKEAKVEIIQWKNYQVGPAVSSTLVNLTTRFNNWTPTVVDWGQPTTGGTFDFNSGNSGSNSHDSRVVVVAGNYLYVGNKNSAGKEFIILSIADTPNLNILGTLDLNGSPQKMAASADYVYIASDYNTQELQIINVKDKSNPVLAGSYDLLTRADDGSNSGLAAILFNRVQAAITTDYPPGKAVAIAYWGGYVFLGGDAETKNNLFIFDVGATPGCLPANPLPPSCLKSKLNIHNADGFGFGARDIKVSADGNYVYVVTDDGKLFRINISNKSSPFIDGVEVSTHNGDKNSLVITNSRAYVGTMGVTGSGPDANEIYIIDISNTGVNPSLMSSFNLGDNGVDVQSLSFAVDKRYLIVLTSGNSKQFQVVNVSNDLSPSLVGTLDLLSVVNAADWSQTYYSEYVVGQVSTAEIQIVNPRLIYQ